MQNYTLDPVAIFNKGIAQYDSQADAELRRSRYLSKVPETPYPNPTIQSVRMSQADGPLGFQMTTQRQRGSCTKPQLATMPDRMASEWYPLSPTVATAIEPFARQGTDTRWLAKSNPCAWKH